MRWLAVALAALALYTIGLGARDLWNPNEPIYGQAVREMVERDDWARPTIDGRHFDEKPVLTFWLGRAVAELRGEADETAVRLPSALAAVALVLLVGLWARRFVDERRALWAAALVGTTYIVFWTGRAAQVDLLLTLWVAAAHACLHGKGRPPTWRFALAGLFVGLGLLTKGPVAALLVAMPHAILAVLDRDARLLRGIGPWVASGVAIAAAGPWYAYIAATSLDSAPLSEMLLRQNVTRFFDPWDHDRPWWYFGLHFWLDMAPWGFLMLAVRRRGERLDRFAWIWLLSTVIFFSLSASKRSVYILPCAPAVALLVSGVFVRIDRTARIVLGLLGGLFVIGAAYGLTRADELPLGATIAALALMGLLWFAAAIRPGRLLPVVPGSLAAFYLVASLTVLPALDARKSARAFGEALAATVPPDERVHAFGLWPWRANYNYYSGRAFVRVDDVERLGAARWVLVERGRLQDLEAWLDGAEAVLDSEIGSNRVMLFEVNPRRARPAAPATE